MQARDCLPLVHSAMPSRIQASTFAWKEPSCLTLRATIECRQAHGRQDVKTRSSPGEICVDMERSRSVMSLRSRVWPDDDWDG